MRKLSLSLLFVPVTATLFSFFTAPAEASGLSASARIEQKADSVLKLMTLDEKIGQMVQYTSDWDVTGPRLRTGYENDIRNGMCGSIFNAISTAYVRKLQKIAVEETRLHIPLIFGYDVIHGYKTIFPISLGEAATWDMSMIEKSARVAASEAAAAGLNWTFAPMCDIAVDPRWGRVAEGAGEDPYLGSCVAAARVKGFQGENNDLSDSLTVLACVKHYAAYGAALAGRDYNTVDMSERLFRDVYLRPYAAAIKAGAMSVMSSFNELNGIPATANKWLLTDILRRELGFNGFVVTDYNAVQELMNHGIAATEADAVALSVNAGIDMDMQSALLQKHLHELVDKGVVSQQTVDEAVRRILRVKFMLGLFDDPYRHCNAAREKRIVESPENMDAACQVAERSFVLLKNTNNALPLKKGDKIAVIGELANSANDLLGSWRGAGNPEGVPSLLDELKTYNEAANVTYSVGCKKKGADRSGFDAAINTAKSADKVVLVIGEDCDWTGEAASRTSIRVPGVQTELLEKLTALHKPVIVVLMNGRPLDLSREDTLANAILETWFAGSRGGKAITQTLFGEYNPSGKLPITFPRTIGQVPIFYYEKNTGRPVYLSDSKYKSKYLDCPNDPLYPFGFGLSYTTFAYSNISLSNSTLSPNSSITASVTVTNTGNRDGEEVVQLYTRDLVGSVTRPVKELKGFQKTVLKAGESKTVSFTITPDMLAFYRADMTCGTEAGDFQLFIGGNSRDVQQRSFSLTAQ